MKSTVIMGGLGAAGRRRYMCKGVEMAAAAGLYLTVWWSVTTAVYVDETIKPVAVAMTSSVVTNGDGGSASVMVDNTKYYVVPCGFISGRSQWKAGDIPEVSAELAAGEGYYFNNTNVSGTHIRGADYVTSKKSGAKRSPTMMIKLKGIEGTLDRMKDMYWGEKSPGKAGWVEVEGTSSYEVRLFCDGSMVYHAPRTNSVSYDFSPYMTEVGDHYLKVRTVTRSELKSDYLKAGDWTESKNQEITRKGAQAAGKRSVSTRVKGASEKDGIGPQSQVPDWIQDQNSWWHKDEDGTYPVGERSMIGDKWYLSDMNGYILTGWQWKSDKEYYLISNRDMVIGRFQYNRIWYYLNPEQGKLTGTWLQQGDDQYYPNPDEGTVTEWFLSRGSRHYLDPRDDQMAKDRVVGEYYTGQNGIWTP